MAKPKGWYNHGVPAPDVIWRAWCPGCRSQLAASLRPQHKPEDLWCPKCLCWRPALARGTAIMRGDVITYAHR